MSTKHAGHFPAQYGELVAVIAQGKSVELTFETRAKAYSMRFRFYAFRTALAREAHELARMAQCVLVTVQEHKDGTATVCFQNRDQSAEAMQLEQALAKVRE